MADSADQNQTGAASQLPLLDVLSPLWKRWRLLGLVFILTLGAAVSLVPFVKQEYKSEAVLILDRASNDIATFDTPLTNLVIDSEAIASEIEILYSSQLAARVVESEGLLDTDEFNPEGETSADAKRAAVHQFLQQLDVQRKGISRAIVVKFKSTDASRAARIVNAIVALYLEHELERKIEQESVATRRLSDDIDALEARIAESEVRIAQYRQQVGQNTTGDESRAENNIAGLNAQRVLAQAESMAAEALLRQADSLAENPAAFASLPSSDISPSLSRLRNNELDLQTKLDQLALTYGNKHPQVQQTRSQLNRTRRDIRTEIDQSLQVLKGTTENARLRVTALTAEMQSLQQAESSTWSVRAQLLALERQRELDVNRLEFYSSRLRELSQSSSIENLKPFARLITTGQISDKAEFPSRTHLLFLLPALVTLGCLGFLVVSGLYQRFNFSNLPALPENTSWFGRIPTASLFHRLPWTSDVFDGRRSRAPLRSLCHGIDTALAGDGRVVMLTGLSPGAGASTLALAVARYFSKAGQSTVLISLDLRTPMLSKDAHVLYAGDLLSADISQTSLDNVLKLESRTGLNRLAVQLQTGTENSLLAADRFHDLAIENLLSSHALDQILQLLSDRFSRVVLDLPPVLYAPDSTIVGRLADVSLIVASPSNLSGPVGDLYRGIERLRTGNEAMLGVVINRMDVDMSDTTCLDYVASDHHHARATCAMSAKVGDYATSWLASGKQNAEVGPSSMIDSRPSVNAVSANEQSQFIKPWDQSEEDAVQSASVMTMAPTRLRGESWLLRQSTRQFSLCVMTTASRPDNGQSHLAVAADLPLACYMRRSREGHAEYVLLLGLFDSRQAAQEMLDRLIADPLPRTTTVLSLSAIHRDILRNRSVVPAQRRVRFDQDVA